MTKQLGLDEIAYLEKEYGKHGAFFKKKKGNSMTIISKKIKKCKKKPACKRKVMKLLKEKA